MRPGLAESRQAARGGLHLKPGGLQHGGGELLDHGVIVDDQDALGHCLPPAPGGAAESSGLR